MPISKSALENQLKKFGKVKVSGNSFKVLLEDGSAKSRIDFLKTINDVLIGYKPRIMNDNPNFSSVGYVKIDNFRVAGKPAKRQGMGSAGLGNEETFINSINKAIKQAGGSIDVCLIGKNNVKFTAKEVTKAVEMGRQTSGGAKSDVDLIGAEVYKISLKQDNAEMWESADTRYGAFIKGKIEEAQRKGSVTLEPVLDVTGKPKTNGGKTVVKLVPESKIKISDAEQKSVVFGSDIKEGKGAVVKKTFSQNDFVYENDCLNISCTKVFRKLSDVKAAGETPTILIRSDASRNSKELGIPGLRIIVSIENSRVQRALSI